MIAVLPTLLGEDNELALVLLPLNSLITDYKRKFTAMKIPFDVYCPKKNHINPHAKFLLISADVTLSSKWPQFLAELAETFNVRRLIFDEAHIPMISTDYRQVMSLLDQIRIIPLQFVLLTGSCPPASEGRMMELFGMEPTSTAIFRGCTDRPELEYIRKLPCTSITKALQEVDHIVGKQKQTADSTARGMVFVPFIDTGTMVAKHLSCDFYSSRPTDHDPDHKDYLQWIQEKEDMYNNWYHGSKPGKTQNNIIVATTALSAGNDYPSVRFVIHVNTPIEMISYIQEVSRAGRDGQPAQCILIPINTKPISQETPGADYKGLKKMHNYVFQEADCLRYAITNYCDGVSVYCYDDPKRQKCSLCATKDITQRKRVHGGQPLSVTAISSKSMLKRKRHQLDDGSPFVALSKVAKSRMAQREMDKIEYIASFTRALAIFNSSCAYCLMKDHTAGSHTLAACPGIKNCWKTYRDWKSSIIYPEKYRHKSCWFCHIPRIGDLLHDKVGKAEYCSYPDIVPVIAFRIFLDSELHKAAATYFKTHWRSLVEYSKWLVLLPTDGSLTHISSIFLWYIKTYFNI